MLWLDSKWNKLVKISWGDKWFTFTLFTKVIKKDYFYKKTNHSCINHIERKKTNENFRMEIDNYNCGTDQKRKMDNLILDNLLLYINIHKNQKILSKMYKVLFPHI